MRVAALLVPVLLGACGPAVDQKDPPDPHGDTSDGDSSVPDTGDTGAPPHTGDTGQPPDTAETGDPGPTVDCTSLPPVPTTYDYVDMASSEDFAFDAEGWVLHVDDRGNLVRQSREGETRIILPSVGGVAGTRFLPNGDIVFANAGTGTIERVTMEGARTAILSGLAYPNGLDVGLDGYVYVSEQGAGQVRRIDPESGEFEIIATGLNQPNGVTFSPDHDTVYIGSFGGGIVYGIDRVDDGWARPRLHAGLPGRMEAAQDPCLELATGDDCFQPGGAGPGECAVDDDGVPYCDELLDLAACMGRAEGDACTTEMLGETYANVCTSVEGGPLFCPAATLERTVACEDGRAYERCRLESERGSCMPSFQDVLVCVLDTESSTVYEDGCVGLAEGDACIIQNPANPSSGECADLSEWGYEGLWCMPGGWSTDGGGGFDAIGTDECGNVYIGEYTTGKLYRWTEPGENPETIMDFESYWIPNLHWGVDAGGFSSRKMYVMDRGRGGLFELDMDMKGHREAYP